MEKYLEVTGKTEDEAVAKGLAQLGLARDDVSVEILERGKTGFLGIGSIPARVRLTYQGEDEPEAQPAAACPIAQSPAQDEDACAVPAPEKPEQDDEVAQAIVRFQTGLFAHMGVQATPLVTWKEDAYQVVLEGENLGALIGHRGETLDAIQQLTGYVVNRGRNRRFRIHVDAEGYRARRAESLERLARKTAQKAVKFRRNMTLEPMNAYERHIIHTALQDFPGVKTYSTGAEPNRRTVVAYDPGQM